VAAPGPDSAPPPLPSPGPRTIRTVRHLAEDGPCFSRRPLRAHEFRFVVHFASFGATVAMLRAAGLDVIDAWSEQGSVLDLSAARATADYVHYLCRRGDG